MYLEAVKSGRIQDTDMILMLSIDGAQLYVHKSSDCWIYIWIVFDYSPDCGISRDRSFLEVHSGAK